MGVSGGCAATIFAKCSGKVWRGRAEICPRVSRRCASARYDSPRKRRHLRRQPTQPACSVAPCSPATLLLRSATPATPGPKSLTSLKAEEEGMGVRSRPRIISVTPGDSPLVGNNTINNAMKMRRPRMAPHSSRPPIHQGRSFFTSLHVSGAAADRALLKFDAAARAVEFRLPASFPHPAAASRATPIFVPKNHEPDNDHK